MILVLSPENDPMGIRVAEALEDRGADYAFLSVHDIPGEVRLHLTADGREDALLLPDGHRLATAEMTAIYHRVGFANFQVYEEFSDAEVQFVNQECQMALAGWLNTCGGLVVNRPKDAGSNASKPFQIREIRKYGFEVPETLVTNSESHAMEFYNTHPRGVIFKSISYHRSIVQRLEAADLDRFEKLQFCPVQLQEYVAGQDVRVHVVGDKGIFPSLIRSEESDYRYDRETEVVPFELPPELEERCYELAAGLGLWFAGIDLRLTEEGEVYCFEVNPSPAFSWYEDRTGQPITECLVDLLLDG